MPRPLWEAAEEHTGRLLRSPTRVVPLAFLAAVVLGTAALSLPVSASSGQRPPLLDALFTSTAAVCVTGLTVVDTASFWSTPGHVIILLLCQVGGFGIMSLGTLLSLVVFRRLGLRSRLLAAAETRAQALGDVRRVLLRLAAIVAVVEAVTTVVLFLRFLADGMPAGKALWYGVFHGVSAFNNAGFTLFPDSLAAYETDTVVNLAVMVAVVLGALGSPVLLELDRELLTPRLWSVHTRLTLLGTGLVLASTFAATLAFERNGVLAGLGTGDNVLAAAFSSVQHTAGFSTFDVGDMGASSTIVTIGAMFVGGGSASTAGGIKTSTFMLLAFVLLAEARGVQDVTVARRRIPTSVQRQAVSIVLLAIGLVGLGTLALLATSEGVSFEDALFEVTSATSTVGLSRGITAGLDPRAQTVLVLLMYIGRVGSVTAASALALRSRPTLYRLPEERPIVG